MIKRNTKQYIPLSEFITEYSERNTENKYSPVAVGKYGIRSRESIYSKELASDYSKNKLIYKNTLTVGMGSKQIDVGVLLDNITYSVSPAYHTYKITNINAKYLDYCIQCRNQDMFNRFVKRGSRQGKNVDLKRWLTYEIPVYDEKSQAEIVDYLNRAHSLVELRQNQLEKMDVLVKSRFVEMFEYDIERSDLTISDVAEESTVGIANSATHAYSDSGVVMLRNQNIRINHLDDSDLIYIKKEFADKYKNKELQENDILATRTGANVGMACIVPEKYVGCQTFTTLILRLRKDICISPVFVCHYINSPIGKAFVDENKMGGGQPNFGAKQLSTMPIVIPDKIKQENFEAFVQQVDKSKVAVQKSLDETQLLFDSLMQKYFG